MNIGVQWILYKVLVVVIGIMLLAAGIVDIRKKQISKIQILLLLVVCCAVLPLKGKSGIADAAGGMAIGLCAIGIAIATREQIGKGDGIVIAEVGIAFGMRKCFLVVCTASFVMCIAAILVLLFRKGSRQTRLPFLPAVFVGYLLCVLM